MPTLNWIGKEKVINHHMDVPYRILEHSYGFDNGRQSDKETNSGNKIIHGDNLEALKSLLPEYEGRIKCIYIDPPYNTGNEGWVYNDNVNDPKIRKWLGKVVGKEAEDLSRHDKWLCMMYPRLKLLNKLLAEDGSILISIDDNEQSHLKLICDEIFGISNYVTSAVWQKSKRGDAKLVSVSHEYIVIYTKNKSKVIQSGLWRKKKEGSDQILIKYAELVETFNSDHNKISKELVKWFNSLDKDHPSKKLKHYRNSDDRGLYFPDNFAGPNDGRKSRPRYDIIHPKTKKPVKKPSTGWRWEEDRTILALKATPPLIHFGIDETIIPCRKSYLNEKSYEPLISVFYKDGRTASRIVDNLLHKNAFDFPKDSGILEEWIGAITKKNSIILDSFAGSGTTAHAVLNLNKRDGGNRKFILIEMEDYADKITAERVKRVMKGYGSDQKAVKGTGGSFDYYDLGKPLFLENEMLNEEVGLEKIREYVWYTETRQPYAENTNTEEHLLGTTSTTAYYFYYHKNKLTTLDESFMRTIKIKSEQYIIYADNCLITKDFMQKYHIIFKKIPRDITRF